MNKYDEIMGKIEVTEEMRCRVMARVRKADLRTEPTIVLFSRWKRYAVLAACFAVILLGVMVGPQLLHPPEIKNPPIQGGNRIVEYASGEELSIAAGVPVSQVKTLPFTVAQTKFLSYWGKLAEITYSGKDGEHAVYRISEGTEDNSGDYSAYPSTDTITVNSLRVELKGTGELYTLACWTDGTLAYSLKLSDGEGSAMWSTIIQSIST